VSATGSRVDPRIERTRGLVVDAAAELLAQEGFERITIDGIAEHSGVARSTIYRHWPDRADLLGQAFAVVCSVEHTPDHGSLVEDLRHKASMLVQGLTEESWGRMLPSLVGASAHDDDLRRALMDFNAQRRDDAIELIERGAARGEITTDVDPRGALERFIGPFFLRRLMTQDPLDAAFVELQLQAICRDLGAPYAPPTERPTDQSTPA
jgi:AcrR family transcriptional regulator